MCVGMNVCMCVGVNVCMCVGVNVCMCVGMNVCMCVGMSDATWEVRLCPKRGVCSQGGRVRGREEEVGKRWRVMLKMGMFKRW